MMPTMFYLHACYLHACYLPKLKQVVKEYKHVEWGDALVDSNDVLQWVYSITYEANKRMMGRKI